MPIRAGGGHGSSAMLAILVGDYVVIVWLFWSFSGFFGFLAMILCVVLCLWMGIGIFFWNIFSQFFRFMLRYC